MNPVPPIESPVPTPTSAPATAPAATTNAVDPQSMFSLLSLASGLRKSGPYGIFILLGAALLYGPQILHNLLDMIHGVGAAQAHAQVVGSLAAIGDPKAVALMPAALSDATGAQNLADQEASGWPTPALVTGKLLISAAAYVFFVILRWLVQQLTHPVPTAWAKTGYSTDFNSLSAQEKFIVYGALRMNSVLLAAAALLFASLIQ